MCCNLARRFLLSIVGLAATALILPSAARGEGCPASGQQTPGPDVIVGDLMGSSGPNISNYSSVSISGVSYETFSMATVSCNLGNTHLQWIDEGGQNIHPVIAQNCFRLKNVNGSRRFEQLAQAWLKHGFCALCGSVCCGSHVSESCDYLGMGCSDPYTSDRNAAQSGNTSGPKWQVNATTGVHIHPISGPNGTITNVYRRLHIPVADLEASTGSGDVNATRYFGEGQYVSADDAQANATAGNKNNNATYRAMSVTGSGTAWTFAQISTAQRQKAGIRAWKATDTTASIPGVITQVVETDIVTPEDSGRTALVIVAAQATKVGAVWHYEWAVENLNSDRSIYSFSIPVSASAVVTNIGFRDVSYWDGDGVGGVTTDGTDWPGVFAGGAVTWACTQTYAQNNNANALRWATMYNFRFDCDQGPNESGTVTLVQFKPGAQTILASTVIPTAVVCNPPVVDPISSPSISCGVGYSSSSPTTSSGTGPITWSLGAGAPAGMTINPGSGVVSWPTPVMDASPYTITTKATNSCGESSQSWELRVNPNAPTINSIANANAVCGAAYTSAAPGTTGGAAPLAWNLVSGPAGMTIDGATGAVNWPNPIATGSPFAISVQAASANNCGTSSPQNWQISVVIGDFDADGLVTESDLPGFVDDLLADVPICAGDLNGDGLVDGLDIPAFDAALGL